MGEQPMTGKAAGELTIREAILSAKLSDWREKLSMKEKQEKRYRFYKSVWTGEIRGDAGGGLESGER